MVYVIARQDELYTYNLISSMVESLGLGAHVSLCTPAWIRNHQFLGMYFVGSGCWI